jgi:hypothetical protein
VGKLSATPTNTTQKDKDMGLFSNFAPDPDAYKWNDDGSRKTDEQISEEIKDGTITDANAIRKEIREQMSKFKGKADQMKQFYQAKRDGLIPLDLKYDDVYGYDNGGSSNPNINHADDSHPDSWMI